MNYIVKVTEKNNNPHHASPTALVDCDWEILKHVKTDSLVDINKCINKLSYPQISSVGFFRDHGYEVIYRINEIEWVYLIGVEKHPMFKEKMRDLILDRLILV